MVSEYSWPADGERLVARARDAWVATVAALPVGTRVTGEVIFRQPFGVFFRDGVPDAVGLAEIVTMPRDVVLPPGGRARIAGEVIWHNEGNYQVKVRFLASP